MTKTVKIILLIFCLLVLLFISATAALPAWISSSSGTKTTLNWINGQIKGRLTVEKIELNWVGSQRLKNLKYEDENGTSIFSLSSFETETSLLYLILGGRSLKKTVLESPQLVYTAQTKAENEEELKTTGRKKTNRGKLISFGDRLLITNGKIVFISPNKLPITVSNILIDKQTSPEHFLIRATTAQGKIEGVLNIDATLGDNIQAKVYLQDFPIAILDQLGDTNLYTEGLGPQLNANLEVNGKEKESLVVNGSIKSANLTALISGTTDKEKFILNPQTHLEFVITPAFFKQLIDEKKREEWELTNKTNLVIQIEKGIFPLNLKKQKDFSEIELKGNAKINRAELHHSTLGSFSIQQFDVDITSHNNLELSFQGGIQGKETTKLAGTLAITPEKNFLFDFTCQGIPAALLELVSVTLEKNVRLVLGNLFDIKGQGTFNKGVIDSNIELTSTSTEVNGHLTGNLNELHFDASGTQQIYGEKAKVIGPSVNFTLKGIGNFEDHFFSIPYVQGNAFNPYFDLDLHGQIGEEGKPFSFDHLQLVSSGNLKKLPLELDLPQSTLQNGTIFIQVDGSKNLITGKAESQALDAHFEVHNFIQQSEIAFDQANMTFSCNLHDFPLAVLNPFIADDFDLTALLGKTVTLTSNGSYAPQQEPRFSVDVNAQGAGFSTSLAIALDETLTVRQNRPSYIYWELTPDRYNALTRLWRLNPEYEPTFTLTRPTQIELNITQFICPTTSSKNVSHFLCQSGFVGDLKVGTTIFRSKKTNESIVFQSIQGSIKGENFSEAINLALSGAILAENIPQSKKSAFSFEGQMFNFWTKEGKFNREGLTVKGVLSGDLLPVRQFTGIVPIDPETRAIIQAVLGELVNTRIYGEISQLAGPLTVDIKSSNFKAKLPLRLERNAIYLRDAVDLEITLTEAVNETLLKDITPLFITGAYSDHPIRVHIDPQEFMIPLKPYSIERLQIGRAIIDIGKIRVRNGGQIQSLMEFLDAKEITPDGLMEAWFTPIYMTLQNGIASYLRFDSLLASNVHIAMWGRINLINGGVKMTLAIAPTTLYQRFKISGLSKTEMFQVKMRGTTTKLELDWRSAYTRIAFIIARTAGGHLGYLLGGILEQLVPKLGEEPSPPPTTDPFPWEGLYSSDPRKSPSRKGSRKTSRKMLEYLIP